MKKLSFLIFLILLSFGVSSQSQFQTFKKQISQAGSLELIEQEILPLKNNSIAKAYDSLNMSHAGSWSLGQSFCIKSNSSGDIVFCGSGAGIIIFDITDPIIPVKLSEIHARALIDDIFYKEDQDRLYLSAYFSGLEIWDVSDMTQPYRLSRIRTSGLPRGGVYVPELPALPGQQTTAFLVTVADGIDVFMVDWDGQPTFVNNQNFTGSALIWNSYGYDDLLFLAAGSSGTKAIDVDVTSTTYFTNLFNVPGQATSLTAQNDLLYVIDYNTGLKIHSFEPTPATLYGQIPISGNPYRICTAGDLAYIANSTTNPGGGINIIDINDPEVPEEIGYYNSPNTFIAGSEDAIYTTGGMDGCLVLDATDPENPVYASNIELPSSISDIAVQGDYAYSGSNGFRVFDVSDKSAPVEIGYHDTEGALVKVYGDHAVFCPKSMGSNNKVNIMDISDKANPQLSGLYNSPVMTYDLALKGNFAFVACWWDGIRVVNFSNPDNPFLATHEMGWVNGATPGEEWFYCQALDIEGDYLYAIDYGPFPDDDTRGLYVFDISDPASPELLKRYADYEGIAYDIEVSNGYAYLADSEGGLSVVSVVDPLNPEQIAYLPLADVAWAVDVFGHFAFVANYINEGVQVINIMNPAAPIVEGYYKKTGCFALNVTYDAGHVFVADGPAGMQIYNFDLLSGEGESSVENKNYLTVSPNPAKDQITISYDDRPVGLTKVSLYNLQGQIILEEAILLGDEIVGESIDVNQLDRGIYLLEVRINNRIFTKKVILK